MCYQGVWFTSKSSSGPWEAASSVPQEIYQIPVSSPANHVTYVTVEESNDDWVVYAAAAGYTGMFEVNFKRLDRLLHELQHSSRKSTRRPRKRTTR